jgi:uncharacterized protein with von Willebrand factor type A (vWA) domain
MLTDAARSGALLDNLLGFGRALRRAGVPTDSSRIALAARSIEMVGLAGRDDFKSALRAVLVNRQQDLAVFDELFDAWFCEPRSQRLSMAPMLSQTAEVRPVKKRARVQESLTPQAERDDAFAREPKLELDAAMSASSLMRLRQADFASLSAAEHRRVQRLAGDIALQLPRVTGRRTSAADRGTALHWGRLMREASSHEGEVLRLPRRRRREQPLPILILVDISGSMERYARIMLAFLHRATQGHRRCVFAFGTGLSDLNPAFRLRDSDAMLTVAAQTIRDFAGGTRIGKSLATLRREHSHRLVGRRTVVLMISDGLDTGDPRQLDGMLVWLGRRCRMLLWLNPLLRFEGYAPLASGASVLHRHAHAMLAMHNLSRLEDLASGLSDLIRQRSPDRGRPLPVM